MSTKFNHLSTCTLLAAAALGACGSIAAADVFTFTYTDTNGLSASGNLTANWNGSTYDCVSGDISIANGAFAGFYPLLPGSGASPSGLFGYSSLLYSGDPTLDGGGLLFTSGSVEVNIWGNGTGNPYTLYVGVGGGYPYTGDNIGSFVISPSVPAPASAAALGLGMLATSRRRRA